MGAQETQRAMMLVEADLATEAMERAATIHAAVEAILSVEEAAVEVLAAEGQESSSALVESIVTQLSGRTFPREMMSNLIAAKANLNVVRRNDGATSLYIACEQGQKETTELLLEAKADPNQAKYDGTTPLFASILRRDKEILASLLHHKADPRRLDNRGRTPLSLMLLEGELQNAYVVNVLKTTVGDPPYRSVHLSS